MSQDAPYSFCRQTQGSVPMDAFGSNHFQPVGKWILSFSTACLTEVCHSFIWIKGHLEVNGPRNEENQEQIIKFSAYVPRMLQPFSLCKHMSQNAQIMVAGSSFLNRREENVATTNIQQTAAMHLKFYECSVLMHTKNVCNPLDASLVDSKTLEIQVFFFSLFNYKFLHVCL